MKDVRHKGPHIIHKVLLHEMLGIDVSMETEVD